MSEKLPRAILESPLSIGGLELSCAIVAMEDKYERVLTQRGMHESLLVPKQRGGQAIGAANLPPFLAADNLKSFIDKHLTAPTKPVIFHPLHGGRTAYGYPAEILPQICRVYMEASKIKEGAPGSLNTAQRRIAERCEILLHGFATVGIIALVDEATGFQELRHRAELQLILARYINENLRPWVKTFPDEFYEEMFRLKGWPLDPRSVKRPSLIGRYTNDIIYARIAPKLLEELQELNPKTEKGTRKHHHHRHFHKQGHPKLKEHLAAVIALMRASPNWDWFHKRMLPRAFPKQNELAILDFGD